VHLYGKHHACVTGKIPVSLTRAASSPRDPSGKPKDVRPMTTDKGSRTRTCKYLRSLPEQNRPGKTSRGGDGGKRFGQGNLPQSKKRVSPRQLRGRKTPAHALRVRGTQACQGKGIESFAFHGPAFLHHIYQLEKKRFRRGNTFPIE